MKTIFTKATLFLQNLFCPRRRLLAEVSLCREELARLRETLESMLSAGPGMKNNTIPFPLISAEDAPEELAVPADILSEWMVGEGGTNR